MKITEIIKSVENCMGNLNMSKCLTCPYVMNGCENQLKKDVVKYLRLVEAVRREFKSDEG